METNQLAHEDLVTYLELARRCLADAEMFDEMAKKLDISDDEMIRLRDKLDSYMGG